MLLWRSLSPVMLAAALKALAGRGSPSIAEPVRPALQPAEPPRPPLKPAE